MSDNSSYVTGPNQSSYGNPDSTAGDNPDDWMSWDWHSIERAILGGTGMTTASEEAAAEAVSNPSSLQEASEIFYNLQVTLQSVGDDLVQQAGVLAGQEGSPWQGPAATEFLTMIKNFANDIYANVSALQDSAGDSVADTLLNNANMLQWAQNQVSYIDSYYANIAIKEGAQVINGAVQVHEIPKIPPMMTGDMMQVMGALVHNYESSNFPTAIQPQVYKPQANTNGNPNTNYNPNSGGNYNPKYEPPTYPNVKIPNYQPPGYPNVKIPNYQPPSYPNVKIPNYSPNSIPNYSPNSVPNTSPNSVPNYSPNSVPNTSGISTPNLTGSPNLNDTPEDAFQSTPGSNLTGSPNSIGSSDLGSGVQEPSLASTPNLADSGDDTPFSALNPAMDEALNPSSLASSDPAGLDDGAGDTADDLSSPSLSSTPLGDETGDAADDSMPYMPGTGAGAGSPSLTSEPSDASGLLGDTDPFSGTSPLTSDELGSDTGAAPADEALGDADGMPYMPGMGAGAGSGALASEPSDASGLLGAESDPWEETEPSTGEEVGATGGAAMAATAADAAWVDEGAALAQAGLNADDEAQEEEHSEPGDEDYEPDESSGPEEFEEEPDGMARVPMVGADGSDEDLSGWDLAGAAADAALFTLGAWATRRGDRDDDEVFARIVSSEQEAWLGEDAALPSVDEEADGLPGAVTWRPNRELGGPAESARVSSGLLRSGAPPKDYDPVAAAKAAAEAAEAAEAERVAAQEAEEEDKRQRSTADLLTQERDMWGGPRPDWDAL